MQVRPSGESAACAGPFSSAQDVGVPCNNPIGSCLACSPCPGMEAIISNVSAARRAGVSGRFPGLGFKAAAGWGIGARYEELELARRSTKRTAIRCKLILTLRPVGNFTWLHRRARTIADPFSIRLRGWIPSPTGQGPLCRSWVWTVGVLGISYGGAWRLDSPRRGPRKSS